MIGWPSSRRYGLTSLALWGGFLAALYCLEVAGARGWPLPVQALIALIPALTVLAQFKLAWDLIADQDEFVRAITTKRLLVAAAATIAVAVGFAPLQGLFSWPALPVWLIYPLFGGCLACSHLS